MRYVKCLLLIGAALALSACGGGNSTTSAGTGIISLNGGTGGTGSGGKGGAIATMKNFSSVAMLNFSSSTMKNFSSAVHGDLRFHAGGTVDASFGVPLVTQNFGSNPVVVSANKTVLQSPSTTPNDLYVTSTPGDHNLYVVNQAGVGTVVTGLTVNPNVTLQLPNTNGYTEIKNAIAISGQVTSDGAALDLRSDSLLVINLGGTVTTKPSPTAPGTASGQLRLSSVGGTLINAGVIEGSGSDGSGGPGGTSGGVRLEAATFIYNTGTVNAKGGKGDGAIGGNGGLLQLQADAASVYTSGIIDASGGNGTSGGASGNIAISGGSAGMGRVAIQGFVTGNGGTGTTGSGGNGADISLNSFTGGVLVAAFITANGGDSTNKGAGAGGGNGGFLHLINRVGSSTANQQEVSPEGIKIFGNITLNGGSGDQAGGNGGSIAIASDTEGSALPGFGSVEFFGYQDIFLNGGTSTSSSGGDAGVFLAILSSPAPIVNVSIPAGGVYNEVSIFLRGGDNNPTSATKGAAGGKGGFVKLATPQANNTSDPARTVLTNSGNIDVTGGAGTAGGAAGSVEMSSFGNLTNSGGITGIGGSGTTQGGAGSTLIQLTSSSSIVNSGLGINANGGDGVSGGNGGNAGNASLLAGNQTTNSSGIAANGGNSTTGTGGNGGTITISSELLFINNTGLLTVTRGNGAVKGKTGNILEDGIDVTPSS